MAKHQTIADLVKADFKGQESVEVERDAAEESLRKWRASDPQAKRLIARLGMETAITRYVTTWRDAHERERDLGDDEETSDA